MKLATAFSRIGAPEMAMIQLGCDHDVVFACEIDKFARQSYKAIYNPTHDFHSDIREVDGKDYKDVDLFVWGFPCQDYSIAGKRAGLEGQRGTLFYEGARITKEMRPKYFIAENVKGLLSSNDGKDFETIMDILRHDVGYHFTYAVLNTKDYGIPQNRERVFIVGFRDDLHHEYISYEYPKPFKLEKRLKNVLEDEVDEKYYLSDKLLDTFMKHTEKHKELKNGFGFEHKDRDGISNRLTASYSKMAATDTFIEEIKVPSAKKSGYEIAREGDSINFSFPSSSTRRGRVGKGVAQTLDCACSQGVVESKIYERTPKILQRSRGFNDGGWHEISPTLTINSWQENNHLNTGSRIRKLTPKECWRLQGFPDWAHDKAKQDGLSDSQLYKQAGNSITVDVMMHLIESLIKPKKESLF